jgi:fibronectin-binding autotransporter adhesin
MMKNNRSWDLPAVVRSSIRVWWPALLLLGLLAGAFLVAPTAFAASVTWDPNGNQSDGPGTWDTALTNWWTGSSDSAWISGYTALFGIGTGGANPYTVNVNGGITAGGIQFNNQLYTLTGGTLTMNASSGYFTPDFRIVSGVAAEIDSAINKTVANCYISGGGTLTLGGTDTFSGQPIWLDNATLQVANGANITMGSFGLVLGNSSPNSNFVQTGGSVTMPSAYIGNAAGGTSSFAISGGTFNSSGTFYLADRANAVMNISGGSVNVGSFQTGTYAATVATINLSGGSFRFGGNSFLGATTGAQGIFNISAGTATLSNNFLMLGNNGAAAAAVVNQSGGLFNLGGSGMLVGWNYTGAGYSYAAYLLSAGTLNMTGGQASVANQNHTLGLFSQTGGVANVSGNLYTGFAASGLGTGVIDISGGQLVHTAGFVMNTGGFNTAGNGVVTVRNNGYFQEQTGNFLVVNNSAATGIVNVVSGGTLEVSRIFAQNGGTSTINFDGGTLRAYNSSNGPNFLNGLSNAFVYPGGLTFDPNGQSVAIGQTLTAPAGYGVGASGSTISVAAGGNGYVAAPLVFFAAPASGGVAATGVATINGSGAVTGITITSPGSGYASGESVAVNFNAGDNTSTAAKTAAAGFNISASTLNGSGGLTMTGSGALTLGGANTYTGPTVVHGGTLYMNGPSNATTTINVTGGALYLNSASNSATTITVAGGATLGGSGSVTTASANLANGGILDFSQNAGNTFALDGLSFAGRATINVDALTNYMSSPALNAGVLTPSSTAGLINIVANLGSTSVLPGTYDLINYTGSIGGAGLSAFTISVNGMGSRQHATLSTNAGQIDVVITGSTPYWNGSQADWRAANAWTLQPDNTPGTYQAGDAEIFDDTAAGGHVALNLGNVSPSSVTFNNNALPYTVSGNFGITGSAALAVTGGGSVTIANSNGYTGGTTVNGSSLSFADGALGSSGTITLSGNSTLQWNGGNSQDISSRLVLNNGATATIDTQGSNVTFASGFGGGLSGSLVYVGSGTLMLAGSNTYTGSTTISNGTLQLGTGIAGQDGMINATNGVTNNAVMAYNLAGSQTASYPISGIGSLIKAGSGTLILNAENSYLGGTMITGGTLVNASDMALGGYTAPVALSGGNSNVELQFVTGVQNKNNSSIYLPITVTSGGTGSATVTFNEGTAFVDASLNISQAVTIRTTGSGSQYGMMGQITGSGAGPGNDSVVFSAPPGTTFYYTAGYDGSGIVPSDFAGNVHFTGSGNIVTQNLSYISNANVNGAIPDTASVTVDAGTTWSMNWGAESIDALSGSGTVNVTLNGPNVLTLGTNNGSGTFSGTITGGGALTMSGSGNETLSGSNTYTGVTTINSGTLQIGNGGASGSLSTASVINNYSTLAFSHSDNVTQGIRFTASPIAGSGGLVQLGPGVLTLNAANTYSGPTTISGGAVNVTTLANINTPSPMGQGTGSAADLVIDGGALQYTGASPASTDRLFTVGPGGKATLDASGGPGGLMTIGSAGGAIAFANNSAPAMLTLTGSGAGILGAVVGDSGTGANVTALVKTGSGTWVLSGNNTYTGPTTVSSGGLYLNGASATKNISVAGGAILGGIGAAPSAGAAVANGGVLDFSQNAGATFTLGGLSFVGAATINVDALANYTSNPFLSVGALTPSTTASLININANVGGTTVLPGTYDLIRYTGSIGGVGLSAFAITINGFGSRQNATLETHLNLIEVVVTGTTPYWSGKQADWRSNNAWTLQPGNISTTYQAGDTEIFDDSAASSNVAMNIGNVSPGIVTFSNNTLAYAVSGSYGITGSASLAINGGGAVTIANSNGYTGGTTLSSGLLNLANAAALGSGAMTISGGTLDNTSGGPLTLAGNNPQTWNGDFAFAGSNPLNLGAGAVVLGANRNVTVSASTLTVGGAISGGGLTVNGNGTLLLTGSNTYSGPTTIAGGTLQLGDGAAGHDGSISGTSGVTNNTTLAYNLAGSQIAAYPIDGSGNLVLSGSGRLTLIGSNSYSGGTNVNGGTLQIGNGTVNGTIGTGTYNLASGASLYLNYATAVPAGDGTWSNNISGSGTLELISAQPVNGLANWGPNSSAAAPFGAAFTGTLQVDNGRFDSSPDGLGGVSNIVIRNSGQFLAWSGTYNVPITIAGNGWGEGGYPGALRLAANSVATWSGPITLSDNAGIEAQGGANLTLTGPITGKYRVEFETSTGATGTINVAPSDTTQNSYASTLIDGGVTVIAGNQYAFSTGGLTLDGGLLELNGYNFNFANLSARVGTIGNYASTGSTLTVGSDNTSSVYAGTLVDGGGGTLALIKTGTGALVLSPIVGASTYSGGTTVSQGTLVIGDIEALADGSSLTVGDAAAFSTGIIAGSQPSSPGGAAVVPEPATLALLGVAAILAAIVGRRIPKGRSFTES